PSPPDRYPLSLHDALPIWALKRGSPAPAPTAASCAVVAEGGLATQREANAAAPCHESSRKGRRHGANGEDCLPHPSSGVAAWLTDRKSTRLNSSHQIISYA